jgi:hypothetical protein
MGKILYFSLQEFGHLNIGLSLARHFRLKHGDKHQVFIVVDEKFEKTLSKMDPNLNLLVYKDPKEVDGNPVDSLWDNLEQLGSLTMVQASQHVATCVEGIGDHEMMLKPQIEAFFDQHKFDYILTDHVSVVPYVINKGIPWGLAFSLNFLLFGLPTLPPATAGLNLDDRTGIQKFLDECKCFYDPYQKKFDEYLKEHDCRTLPYHYLFYESPYLNLYLCPKELDYFTDRRYAGNVNFQAAPIELLKEIADEKADEPVEAGKDNQEDDDQLGDEPTIEDLKRFNRRRSTRKSIDIFNCRPKLPGNWIRMDSTISKLEPVVEFPLPDKLVDLSGELIFFSMGSLFSNCLPLMRRLIAMLEQLPYRFIVSKGPRGDELGDLPANCAGSNFLPQRSVLATVQMAIHHGGNNTLCECFHFGVPSVIMPLMGDQPDTAERLRDTRLGRVLNPFTVTLEQLQKVIVDTLADQKLNERMRTIGERIREDNGFETACDQLVDYIENNSN